ncbi:hypothetical protein C3747_255g41 [Trypanosoma cruzi]|uniref:CRAL-TRIO domain-containing protein n=2 Tax=Trypanosoma cruzi TaxID=5693 RepID=Q4DCM5_TRYCC|nr:hypothetical protein, conserved [Trypanosoma cruzi]EAN90278.1 hypothetical protein, conserved [Trypanosoma cruzi]PWU96481.1 hypothetical protein C3747_255g41 [Trypanosoma cruzi]RNC49613.1 hypothetical protein TcCL_NonESM00476 [Trypanosoma cruzi]|eukprot:XP_812129.1 hypothetical protein [Trypanosoma cruzi strain CL Brener]
MVEGAKNPAADGTEGWRLYDESAEKIGSSREQQVLLELKKILGWTPSVTLDASVDAFLLRYLSAVHLSVSEAVALLKQRRSYEMSLLSLHITAPVLEVLRSGTVSVIGRDVLGRPVLYVRAHRFIQFGLDAQDMQRFLSVVMEYMLSYCTRAPSSPSHGSRNGKTLPSLHQQQIILLVNEEVSSWHASQAALSNAHAFRSIMKKYYPRFIGLLLIFEASWDVRQGIKAAFGDNPGEEKRVVQMVTRGNIQKYIDRYVLTQELGGSNTSVESPDNFADAVLSHWFNVRSYLSLEDPKTRPLWQLPPSFVNINDWNQHLQRREMAATLNPDGNGLPQAQQFLSRCTSSQFDSITCTSLRRSTVLRRGLDEDEGFCSALSEVEDMFPSFNSPRLTPREVSLDMDGNNSSAAVLLRELHKERELRIAAEQQLRKVRLGITLDLSMATEVERILTHIHRELNVLVANVVTRARDAAANGSPPTLLQLLDLTLLAIEMAVHKAQRVPAMKFAVPVTQSPENDSPCCCVM